MNNNDILRRLRYALNISDSGAKHIFKLMDQDLDANLWASMLKKEEDPGYERCRDAVLETFLDGYIVFRRGKPRNERPQTPVPLTNNQILRKLKIALKLDDTGVLDILDSANFRLSKAELSALFRHPGHPKYKTCGNQILRNFITGLANTFHKEVKPRPDSKPFSKKKH